MQRPRPHRESLPPRCLHSYYLALALAYFAILLLRPGPLPADNGVPYRVIIEGVSDPELRELLEAVSDTVNLRDRPPASLNLLRRRADRDIPRLLKALKSQGFYGARISIQIDHGADPVSVKFQIDPGPPYLLKSVDVEISGGAPRKGVKVPGARELGLVLEERARSKPILDADKSLIRKLRQQGFPFAKVIDRKVVVDHATRTVAVTFHLDPGPPALFGATEITGVESVDEPFLRGKIPWKEGDRFNGDLLPEAQKRLMATGLIATAQVKAGEALDEQGRVPVSIVVKERKHRTIKAGISYMTDEGPGAKLSWEHRNFFGRGERLGLSGTLSEIAYAAEGSFRKPEFMREDQALLLGLRLAEDRPDAYTSDNLTSLLEVERSLSKEMKLAGGLGYRFSEVDQLGQKDSFGLLLLPWRWEWDTRDTPLDPTLGGRLDLRVTPFWDTFEGDFAFARGYTSYSRYLRLLERPSLVAAGRVGLGSIWGAQRDDIPADERFYAGGGGSIRGYPYKTVGPLRRGEPIGGRSLIEFSLELRAKITDTIGFVTFIDGGNAYGTEFPDFDEEPRWGAGVGLRYFTPVGPLRLDVAVPLNPRDKIDDAFQIYISLGQAF